MRASHDTVYADVNVRFNRETKLVTLAMLPAPDGWVIANFIYPGGELAANLRKAANDAAH